MSSPLDRMNPRERVLLVATLSVLAVAAVLLGVRKGYATLRELDRQIADREAEIEGLRQQNVQAEAVNTAYDRVVTEHSSQLTMAGSEPSHGAPAADGAPQVGCGPLFHR